MKHSYEYAYNEIILKPLQQEDLEGLRVLRNSNKEYFIHQAEITMEAQKAWYQSYLLKTDDIMFKVVKKENEQKLIGAVALYHIKENAAEVGRIMIDKNLAPEKGMGTQTLKAVCSFGFHKLRLEKIVCEVFKTNIRSLSAFRKAGFSFVGEKGNLLLGEFSVL